MLTISSTDKAAPVPDALSSTTAAATAPRAASSATSGGTTGTANADHVLAMNSGDELLLRHLGLLKYYSEQGAFTEAVRVKQCTQVVAAWNADRVASTADAVSTKLAILKGLRDLGHFGTTFLQAQTELAWEAYTQAATGTGATATAAAAPAAAALLYAVAAATSISIAVMQACEDCMRTGSILQSALVVTISSWLDIGTICSCSCCLFRGGLERVLAVRKRHCYPCALAQGGEQRGGEQGVYTASP
eukprot:20306-Heterococcus_DN1.PRE.2